MSNAALLLSRLTPMDCDQADIEELLLSSEYVKSPYETFDLLREHFPVFWSEKWNCWILTRYDDVIQTLKSVHQFSNRGRYTQYLAPLTSSQRDRLGYLEAHYERGGLVQSDPPQHTRFRKLIGGSFTPQVVLGMEAIVRDISSQLIDSMKGCASVDLIKGFAFPLPATVIAGILGVPSGERDNFKHWSTQIQAFLGTGIVDYERALSAQDAWRSMNEFFSHMLAERRLDPRVDLLSELARITVDGDQLTTEEIVRTCGALLVAGHETTTNLISNALWLLLNDPAALDQLRKNPRLYGPAIEEFLRLESPFQSVPRTVVADFDFQDRKFNKGQLVYAMLGAANRDPNEFDSPQMLDLQRTNNKHLAFGYGIHFCLGASLARLEAAIAIKSLVEAFPNMKLDRCRPPIWKSSMVQRGMESFWIELDG